MLLARYLLASYMSVRLSVRPPQAGIVSKRLDESSWFLARRLLCTYPTLCYKAYKEIWVSEKLGTLCQTPDLQNFATASRSCCQQNSSTSTTAEVDDTYTTIDRVVAVYCRSVNWNPLTPLLRFVVDLSYNLSLQLTKFWPTARSY